MQVVCEQCGPGGEAGLTLIYNGEIYNFAEIRRWLEMGGHQFQSRTDSEVLLHLYATEGVEMVSRLNGIFAFAIWDNRDSGRPDGIEKGDLFLARDQIGVKPLYYAATERGLLFASEIKAILQDPNLSRELDTEAIHYQLAYLWTPAPYTVLKHVRKLPPGSALVVRRGRIIRQWAYYDLPYGRDYLAGSENEIAAELRDRVEQAVTRQLVADVPVGAFLSGGLDSSAVVAMMRKLRPTERFDCYTIGFAGGGKIEGAPSDLPYARRVARHLGVNLHTLEVNASIIEHLDRMLFHLDEPQADPAPINAMLIAERARQDGIPVLLSGAGGDDIFSGYRRHVAVRHDHIWDWLPAPVRRALARQADSMGGGNSNMKRRLAKVAAHAHLDPAARLVAYFWWSSEALRRTLYSKDLAAKLNGVETAAPFLASLERIADESDPLNRMLYLEGKHFLADHNLNYTDKTGMAVGVEVRVPLLDLELVDFATRIPPRLKQRGTEGKYIFKRAMEPLLPRDVIYRAKTGFGAPLRQWLRTDLRVYVEDALSDRAVRARGLFDPAAVQRLINQDRIGAVDGSFTIFALLTLELWCRMFVDVATPDGANLLQPAA